MALIFGAMFAVMRQGLYKLWVCEMGPRIQSPTGCDDTVATCRGRILAADPSYIAPPHCDQ